ncbi:MAG: pentapeptide repeat-containing protein [Leptospirales bacterium]|nr:pentapeptide repeat-containing protein [Leptospirales bacterium]
MYIPEGSIRAGSFLVAGSGLFIATSILVIVAVAHSDADLLILAPVHFLWIAVPTVPILGILALLFALAWIGSFIFLRKEVNRVQKLVLAEMQTLIGAEKATVAWGSRRGSLLLRQNLGVTFLVVGPAMGLFLFLYRFAALHSTMLTWFHFFLLLLGLIVVRTMWSILCAPWPEIHGFDSAAFSRLRRTGFRLLRHGRSRSQDAIIGGIAALALIVSLNVSLAQTRFGWLLQWELTRIFLPTLTVRHTAGLGIPDQEQEQTGESILDLSHRDLQWADLRGSVLSGAWLSGTNLRGARLSDADLSGIRTLEEPGDDAGCSMYIKEKRNAVNLSQTDLKGASLAGADLRCADLDGSDLQGTILEEANLLEATLRSVRAAEARFSGANLTDAVAIDGVFNKAKFTGALLRGTLFDGSHFQDANLIAADCSFASFQSVNFTGADLRGATFLRSQLTGTTFKNSITAGTILFDALGTPAGLSLSGEDVFETRRDLACRDPFVTHALQRPLPEFRWENQGKQQSWNQTLQRASDLSARVSVLCPDAIQDIPILRDRNVSEESTSNQ